MTKNASKKPTAGRYVLYAVLFVGVLVASIFAGPITFYFSFQKELEAVAAQVPGDCVIQVRPEALGMDRSAEAEAATQQGWHRILDGDLSCFLPPGEIKTIQKQGQTLVVEYGTGKVLVDRMPVGFLKNTYFKILENLDADPSKIPPEMVEMTEEGFLERVCGATLSDYRFEFDQTERTMYSADLMSKMLLFDMESVKPFVLMEADDRMGVFFLKKAASAKIAVTAPDGFFVYSTEGLDLSAPTGSDPWLEFHPVSEDQRRAWVQSILDGDSGEADPMRAWAETQVR